MGENDTEKSDKKKKKFTCCFQVRYFIVISFEIFDLLNKT